MIADATYRQGELQDDWVDVAGLSAGQWTGKGAGGQDTNCGNGGFHLVKKRKAGGCSVATSVRVGRYGIEEGEPVCEPGA